MACLDVDTSSVRLGTATCVAGGTITQLLRASTARTVTPPQGDLLLAAALTAAASATHFQTTKRAAAQRKELIRQPSDRGSSYSQQAATLRDLAARAPYQSTLGSAAAAAPLLHNLQQLQHTTGGAAHQQQRQPHQQAPHSSAGKWHFDLALQSSLL